jgi:hypothetical protein
LNTVNDEGIRVRPEHIHQSLRQFAGIANHVYSEQFPLSLNKSEQLMGLWGNPQRPE